VTDISLIDIKPEFENCVEAEKALQAGKTIY
jgi:hypothetical protein